MHLPCTYTLNAQACISANSAVVAYFFIFLLTVPNQIFGFLQPYMEPSFVDYINLVLLSKGDIQTEQFSCFKAIPVLLQKCLGYNTETMFL